MASNPRGYNVAQYTRNITPNNSTGQSYLPPWGKGAFVGWIGRRPVAFTTDNPPAPPPPQRITANIHETQAPQTDAIAATVTPQ